jgi:hypothetical protein
MAVFVIGARGSGGADHFAQVEATHKAQGLIYSKLQRQASLLAFVGNFRMLALICLLCSGLAFLFQRARAMH